MLFGESAGAADTCVHLASPLSKGLFHSALMQSGGCGQKPLADVEAEGRMVVQLAGCNGAADVLGCLRAIGAAALTKAAPGTVSVTGLDRGLKYAPNVDGRVLLASPITALGAGQHNPVPFVVGANSDETSRSTPMVPSAQAYADIIHSTFGQGLGDQVLAQYPAAGFATPRQALIAVMTDVRFVCPSRKIARAAKMGQSAPVWRYFFTHALDSGAAQAFGAWHGLEITFLFGALRIAGYVPSAAEEKLSADMIGYWSRLAKMRDPNGGGAPAWPLYDATSDAHIVLDDPITSSTGLRTARCDFWDSLTL
jgi:para-nitrobenzyl esterase